MGQQETCRYTQKVDDGVCTRLAAVNMVKKMSDYIYEIYIFRGTKKEFTDELDMDVRERGINRFMV